MPIPKQRDMEATRRRLGAWLAARLDGADVRLSPLSGPGATGFSNETLLFDAEWDSAGGRQAAGFVARVAPTAYNVFYEADFAHEYRVMRVLHQRTDVRVPPTHWYEEDAGLLGAPFFLMSQVPGDIPGDQPPYHAEGWLAEAAPAAQRSVWMDGLEAMAQVHRVDWRSAGLAASLDRSRWGRPGVEQQLGYYREYLEWAADGRPQPTARAALEWLEANRPATETAPALLWGDARIGNQIFAEGRCVAVLDWEMATLGEPEQDLAWWLAIDRIHSEVKGLPRLPGLPGRAETVDRFEALTGRPVRNLEWYEVFAGFRFAVIMARIAQLFVAFGMPVPHEGWDRDNSATRLLARLIDVPAPAGAEVR